MFTLKDSCMFTYHIEALFIYIDSVVYFVKNSYLITYVHLQNISLYLGI